MMFAVVFKKIRFEFNRAKGRLEWSQRGVFSRKGGVVPLSEIENVIFKISHSDPGEVEYIVFIITTRGKMPKNVFTTNEKQIRVTHMDVKRKEQRRYPALSVI